MRRTNPLTINKIEAIARKTREYFQVSNDSKFPIMEVIGYLFENYVLSLQVLEDDNKIFDNDVPAVYNPIDNFIYVKESVLKELEEKEYRSNFTLAHELFHFIQCKILEFEFEDVEYCKSYEDAEWQANEFAAQLLIPTEYAMAQKYDVQFIIEKFEVSEIFANTRRIKCLKRKHKNISYR